MKPKVLISLVIIAILLSGCIKSKEDDKIIIAEQYGLAYAPIQIMKEKGYLEELLPDTQIEWAKLANTAAIREAMLSSDLDVGFMAIPPFVIGKDNDMNWKIISGLSKSPLGLVTNDVSINSLEDFQDGDKIALPQPGSIQHILLAMACEKQLGKADILDNMLVSMKHPDGLLALESGNEVKAHFTSPPYLFEELENENNHIVITGEDAIGDEFTFIVGVCNEDFYLNTEQYEALEAALKKSIDFINTNQEESIEILSKSYNIEENKLQMYLNEGMEYSEEVLGVEVFVDFMLRNGYIDNSYKLSELVW